MEYVQLNETFTEATQIEYKGNIEWDSTHFCTPGALTPEEAQKFRVYPLSVSPIPPYDELTQ